jgi:general secretion pathway protein I
VRRARGSHPLPTRRGFTLIEVLVALAVAAIGLAAVLAIVTNTANAAAGVRERTFAAWIAANRIAETRLSNSFPSVDRTSGNVEFAGARWVWEQTVTQTEIPGMRRLDVRVRLADGPEDAFLANVAGFVSRAQMANPAATTPWNQGANQSAGQAGGAAGGQPGNPGGQPGALPGGAAEEPPANRIVVPGITP